MDEIGSPVAVQTQVWTIRTTKAGDLELCGTWNDPTMGSPRGSSIQQEFDAGIPLTLQDRCLGNLPAALNPYSLFNSRSGKTSILYYDKLITAENWTPVVSSTLATPTGYTFPDVPVAFSSEATDF